MKIKKNSIATFLKWLTLSVLAIFIGFVLFLSIPCVQNILFERVLRKFSEQTHFSIQHKNLSLKWFGEILLTDFEIKDANKQLLCAISRLKLFVNPLHIFFGKDVVIDYLEVTSAQLQLVKGREEAAFNVQMLLRRLETDKAIPVISPTYVKGIRVEKVFLENLSIVVDDQSVAHVSTGFDPRHIKVEALTVKLNQLGYAEGTLVGTLEHFTGYYLAQDLKVHKLHTQFKLTPYAAVLNNLQINTDHSHFKGNVNLSYEELKTLASMPTQAHIVAQLEELKLDSQELAHFVPYFQGHNTAYTLKGRLVGKVNDFYLEDFCLEFGENKSHLVGSFSLKGLSNLENAYFSFSLRNSCLYTLDLMSHVAQDHHHILQRIQHCNMQSNISGTPDHFIVKGNFLTGIGKMMADMEVTVDEASHDVAYKGVIATESFKVGKLMGINDLHEVTMRTHIDGHGINLETATFYLKTDIKNLGFQAYNYQNIRTNGRFGKLFFKGNIAIEDPNLIAHLDTKIDWRNPHKELFVKGLLSHIALNKLRFSDKSANLSSEINIILQGESWDDFTTDATFNRIQLEIEDKPLHMDQLHILNGRKGGCSTLTLNSDLLDIQAEGAVKYSSLVNDLREFVGVYQQRLLNYQADLPSYTNQSYNFKYQLDLKDINPLLYIVAPNIYVAPHSSFRGSFSQQEEVKFELHMLEVDSLAFAGNQLQKTEWHVTALQNKNGELIAATSKLKAYKQQWKEYTSTESFGLDVNWINDQISFKNTIGNENSNLHLNVAGIATLGNSGIHITLSNTGIRIAGNMWDLHPANTILIHKSYTKFHNILLSNEAQQISIQGKYSSVNPEKLVIRISNLELNNFTSFVDRKVSGIIHGTLILMGNSVNPRISSNINIHAITIGDLMVGDLCSKAAWDKGPEGIHVACQLKQVEKPIIHITGTYNPNNTEQGLNLIAEFSDAQLALLEPFVTKVFGQLRGKVDGKFYIKGPLKTPHIDGKATLKDILLKFGYLNALYKGNAVINCAGNTMEVQNLHLSDDQDGQADFRGNIYHTYFKGFILDLVGDIDKLKILNTKYEDNEYFYGKGIVSGNIALSGAVNNVNIIANAITQKGTNLVIPIRKYNKKVGQENYIRFVDFKSCKGNIIEALPSIQLKGLNLYVNLEITSDAWAEIMLNGKDGDVIQTKGKGLLTIKSDSEGRLFSITGDYELVEGTYNFSIYEIVRKKFKILEGSTISWIDKPYDAILHVKAIYDQRTTLNPLLEKNQDKKDKKKYPVRVILELEGILAAPDIRFGIQFPKLPDNPDLQEAIHTFKEKLSTDSNYLKNQVFSLVMLKSFFSSNSVNIGNNTLQRSVGEIFSQQLSSLAEQLDANLEIDTDIDLEELSQEKTTSVPVKISYNLLAGRLIVARESKINFDVGKEIDVANMVGDWSIEYGLTSDNRVRVKLHVSPSGLQTSRAISSKSVFGGISFVYVKSFNRWRELFFHNPKNKSNRKN